MLEHGEEGRFPHELEAAGQDVPLLGEDVADAGQQGELCRLPGALGEGEAASDLGPQLDASRRKGPSVLLPRLGELSLRVGAGCEDPRQNPERETDHPEGPHEPAWSTPLLVASRGGSGARRRFPFQVAE